MSTEAMKLALEALDWMYMPGFTQDDSPINNAITALREALAQPQQEPVAWMFQHEETGRTLCVDAQQVEWGFEKGNPRLKKIAPLYTSPPAQPQQEPVAWMSDCAVGFRKAEFGATPTVPLYTSPPAQRKPLTRDQVNRMLTDAEYDTANFQARWNFLNGVRQCEAAHGIKGDA